MKKKILFGFITGLFVVAMMFNLKINTQSNDNISLQNIAALSTANAEDPGGYEHGCNIYWHGPFCGYYYAGGSGVVPIYWSAAVYF